MAWVGRTDLRAAAGEAEVGLGPIAQAIASLRPERVELLVDLPPREVGGFTHWLASRSPATIRSHRKPLSGPTRFDEIYRAASAVLAGLWEERVPRPVWLHLSPGTPAMAAIWVLLGCTRFPATFIESSRDHGVREVEIPFELSVEFLPGLLQRQDQALSDRVVESAPLAADLGAVLHRSPVMRRVIDRLQKAARRSVPILFEGETGTGKELLARAAHSESPRRSGPFVAVNCGALAESVVEAELFGHEAGAFTGASRARPGLFEAADGGTLFLDEVGELALPVQVKLLRALQDGEIRRLGSDRPRRVDVRVLAATHRSLAREVAEGRFREDLFYRLAVAVIRVPPLRDREGDLGYLVDSLLGSVNAEEGRDPSFGPRQLSPGARQVLLDHRWPGNVRELRNTLRRLVVWSDSATVTREEAREALLVEPIGGAGVDPGPAGPGRGAGPPSLPEGFDLREHLAGEARRYLEAAMELAGGRKSRAAALLGLPSHQTLSNWLGRYLREPGRT